MLLLQFSAHNLQPEPVSRFSAKHLEPICFLLFLVVLHLLGLCWHKKPKTDEKLAKQFEPFFMLVVVHCSCAHTSITENKMITTMGTLSAFSDLDFELQLAAKSLLANVFCCNRLSGCLP
jgi:hypothetical protein